MVTYIQLSFTHFVIGLILTNIHAITNNHYIHLFNCVNFKIDVAYSVHEIKCVNVDYTVLIISITSLDMLFTIIIHIYWTLRCIR